jgi:hypothetical protein
MNISPCLLTYFEISNSTIKKQINNFLFSTLHSHTVSGGMWRSVIKKQEKRWWGCGWEMGSPSPCC